MVKKGVLLRRTLLNAARDTAARKNPTCLTFPHNLLQPIFSVIDVD